MAWRIGGIALFSISALLLFTFGGAIVAAPITVPLMLVVARHRPTVGFRSAGTLLAALTVGELVWALTYTVADDAKPWIWLLPLVAVGVAAFTVLVLTKPDASVPAGV